jgi:DNA repair exonuclease SbcCD ATPase subunit
VRARNGVITQETEERATWTYRARNENTAETTLIVEHRVQPGWKLAEGQTPVESTADAQRFRVVLPVAKETVLEVREVRQGQAVVTISDVDDTLLTRLAQSGVSSAALEAALRPVIVKKNELAALEGRQQALRADRETIAQDQQRLRENMKALRGSSEEKQLLQRYTRQLDQQETRLEGLQQQETTLSGQIEKTRGELAALIGSVSFELPATAQVPSPR